MKCTSTCNKPIHLGRALVLVCCGRTGAGGSIFRGITADRHEAGSGGPDIFIHMVENNTANHVGEMWTGCSCSESVHHNGGGVAIWRFHDLAIADFWPRHRLPGIHALGSGPRRQDQYRFEENCGGWGAREKPFQSLGLACWSQFFSQTAGHGIFDSRDSFARLERPTSRRSSYLHGNASGSSTAFAVVL